MKICTLLYMPVLHEGYLQFLNRHEAPIFLVGEGLVGQIATLDYITRKDRIRRVKAPAMMIALGAIFGERLVEVIDSVEEISKLNNFDRIFMPAEDLAREIKERFLCSDKVVFESVFLRWNRDNTESGTDFPGSKVNGEEFSSRMLRAVSVSDLSSDWWRQVGSILVKNGVEAVVACNTHHPDSESPYAFGDPRSIYKKGIAIDVSTAEHAEAVVVGTAAKLGISTEGCDLYVTDFPCPPCAKLIARSGIRNLYYLRGYSVLDGKSVLENAGISIYRVTL